MTKPARVSDEIQLIPIGRIDILNPRERNQKAFREIVASIKALGLKKPITVTRRGQGAEERYLLVCGQGRVEAFMALGETHISYDGKTVEYGAAVDLLSRIRTIEREMTCAVGGAIIPRPLQSFADRQESAVRESRVGRRRHIAPTSSPRACWPGRRFSRCRWLRAE